MNTQMYQRVIKTSNRDKLYLSPYIKMYRVSEKCMLIKRTDSSQHVLLSTEEWNSIENIIDMLYRGISRTELLEYLQSIGVDNMENWINICIEEGVIE